MYKTESDSDGKILLTFLKNNIEVRGDFFPPLDEEGEPINGDYILDLLAENRISYGIDHGEIHKAFTECVEFGQIVRDVLIARGDPPVEEVPEYMQLNPYIIHPKTMKNEKANIDHRVRSPFIIVRKGMALAKLKHRKPGKNGTNVFGEEVLHGVANPKSVTAGENTRMEGRLLLSDINGQFVLFKGEIRVRDYLIIKGPVGYSTGNIIFPGNVEIEGPVSDGFKIYSGGSVTIKQTFDVTNAITKGDLNVAGGIIGRGQAMVKVGGALRTKFIQNCRVVCRKTVKVDKEVIHSHIYTLERLEMGEKGGRILGGEIYAVKGVSTVEIGKELGKAARIHCGIDFTIEQEKEKSNTLLRMLAIKINRLRELLEDPDIDAEKRRKLEEVFGKMIEEQKKAQAKVSDFLGKINSCMSATVDVKGTIAAGTLIEICQKALFVSTPLKKVRISLNQENNSLSVEELR